MQNAAFAHVRAQYAHENPFLVFGLAPGCTLKEVTEVYRSEALLLHPDKPPERFNIQQ